MGSSDAADNRRIRFHRRGFCISCQDVMREVLFICTGNYYRSRFAEAWFNFHAELRGVAWRAFSRGLATHLVDGCGEISPHTRAALALRKIPLRYSGARPTSLATADLVRAARVIALKEAEHRALMRVQFPAWENRIHYWHVHDLDAALPEAAVPEIEQLVGRLLDEVAVDVGNAQPRSRPA
jgi:protein-tyrosine phosphatase